MIVSSDRLAKAIADLRPGEPLVIVGYEGIMAFDLEIYERELYKAAQSALEKE